jgi:pimeloyl-ACP methyl ester carboxylesterase
MTSTLTVGVGAAVATDELDRLARVLQTAAEECHDIAARVRLLRTGGSPGRDADLGDVQASITASAERLSALTRALRAASALYSATERTASFAIEAVSAQIAAVAGLLLSRLGVVLLPILLTTAGRVALVWGLIPSELRELAVQSASPAVERAMPLMSEPAVLQALRMVLSGVDDAALGVIGVPPAAVGLVGETGLAISGIDSAALAVVGLAALAGASGVDAVRIDRVGSDLRRGGDTRQVAAPRSLADRIDRIPDPATPIVVERYLLPDGTDHVEVYISGTDSDATLGGDRPWDMASNVALIAGEPASSLQAVRAALISEGVTSDTSVVFTGYSQGGAIATALAESGAYRTAGLVTVGAPSGGLPVTGDYPAIVIEHRDDLVPVLSGIRRETTAVIVRGDALSDRSVAGGALPAHDLDLYRRTAARADAFESAALRTAIDALPQFGHAEAGTRLGDRSAYTATRIPSGG